MSGASHNALEAALVAAQIGRVPRAPWRVSVRCRWDHPSVIVSPATLQDGTPFPTLAWLTCPYLIETVSALESDGGVALWATRVAQDPDLARELMAADVALRAARAALSGGVDVCEGVGIAGQKDPMQVKCLHAHVALALMGIEDPIGAETLGATGTQCEDQRCARLLDTVQEGVR